VAMIAAQCTEAWVSTPPIMALLDMFSSSVLGTRAAGTDRPVMRHEAQAHLLSLVGREPGALAGVGLGAADPDAEGLVVDAELGRDGLDRLPLRRVLLLVGGQDCDGSVSQQAPIRSLPSRPASSCCTVGRLMREMGLS
jgi:hypothetical protein